MNRLDKKNIEDVFALTPMQAGMLFHYLRDPGGDAYFEQLVLGIEGEIDTNTFESAWQTVVKANEMLRAVFRWEGVGDPVQVILKESGFKPVYYDLTSAAPADRPSSPEQVKERDRQGKFDLRQVPFRVTLVKTAAGRHDMIITSYHILYDGWSSGIILREFWQAYDALSGGKTVRQPDKPKFKHFVHHSQSQDTGAQARFWKDYVKEAHRPAGDSAVDETHRLAGERQQHRFRLGETGTQRLEAFVKEHKITLAAFLYTAWGILIQKVNSRQDVIFDTTAAGRSVNLKGIDNMVGLCINTLPLRIRAVDGETVLDCVKRTYRHLQARQGHENTPLSIINGCLEGLDRRYLFDSVMVIENYPLEQRYMRRQGSLRVTNYSTIEKTHHDVTAIVTLFADIDISLTFHQGVLDRRGAEALSAHFLKVVDDILSRPHQQLREIEIVGREERERWERGRRRIRPPEADTAAYAAAVTAVEMRLTEIWSRVLGRERTAIGRNANFFDFGGHSLKAAALAAEVHREFNVRLPLSEVFGRPTVRQLAAYIEAAAEERYRPLQWAEKREYYEAASAQRRFYMLQQLEPASTAYNVSTVMTVSGRLSRDRLQRAFERLIQRHESLRTSFELVAGELQQRIHEHVDFQVEYHDLPDLGTEEFTEFTEFTESRIREFVRAFDLSRAPLLRVTLIPSAEREYLLIVDMHHMVTDAVSMDRLIKEFSALYRREELPLLKFQYKDYAHWQQCRLLAGELKDDEAFWLRQLSGELPVLNMATDFPRPTIQSFFGDRFYFSLDKQLTGELYQLIRETGTTLFMLLLTVFNTLLYRYTGQEDILVGTTAAGRDHGDVGDIIGLFIETLVMRSRPRGEKRFVDFLQEVKDNSLRAFQHQGYPFGELLKRVAEGEAAATDLSMNPLFNAMLIVQNVEMSGVEVEGLSFAAVNYYSQVSKVDVTLEAVEAGGEIRCHLEYAGSLFKGETIKRFAGHFVRAVREIAGKPSILLSEIELMDEEEAQELRKFCSTDGRSPSVDDNRLVQELFNCRVERTPHHIAARYGEKGCWRNLQLSYRELGEKVNGLGKMIEEL